jgi:hypothetical protein
MAKSFGLDMSIVTAKEAQAFRLPALIEALESEDSQEGVLAFREKRPPIRGCPRHRQGVQRDAL